MTHMTSQSSRPMILRSADPGEILRVNGAFTEQFGLTSEELAARPFLDWIHPDDRKTMEQELNAGDGSLRARHRTKQDEWTFLEWRGMRNSGNAVALGLLEDESDAATKADGSDVPSQRTTLSEPLEAMVHIVEAKTDGLRCSILLVDPEHEYVTVGAGPSLPADYNAAVEGLRIGPAVGSCGTASYWNVPIVVEERRPRSSTLSLRPRTWETAPAWDSASATARYASTVARYGPRVLPARGPPSSSSCP